MALIEIRSAAIARWYRSHKNVIRYGRRQSACIYVFDQKIELFSNFE